MARLPSERYVINQIDGLVVLWEDGTEAEIVRFDPTDDNATVRAQFAIYLSDMEDEDKSFAHFWCGYFHAHAGGTGLEFGQPTVITDPLLLTQLRAMPKTHQREETT